MAEQLIEKQKINEVPEIDKLKNEDYILNISNGTLSKIKKAANDNNSSYYGNVANGTYLEFSLLHKTPNITNSTNIFDTWILAVSQVFTFLYLDCIIVRAQKFYGKKTMFETEPQEQDFHLKFYTKESGNKLVICAEEKGSWLHLIAFNSELKLVKKGNISDLPDGTLTPLK